MSHDPNDPKVLLAAKARAKAAEARLEVAEKRAQEWERRAKQRDEAWGKATDEAASLEGAVPIRLDLERGNVTKLLVNGEQVWPTPENTVEPDAAAFLSDAAIEWFAKAESAEAALQELVEAARRLTSHTCDLPFDSCREVKKFRAAADRVGGV